MHNDSMMKKCSLFFSDTSVPAGRSIPYLPDGEEAAGQGDRSLSYAHKSDYEPRHPALSSASVGFPLSISSEFLVV